VLAVSAQYQVWVDGPRRWGAESAGRFPPAAWPLAGAGAGATGARRYDWAGLPLGAVAGQRPRWLWCRRSLRTRGTIDESFQSAQGTGGLAHEEVRSGAGWYRPVTLARLAHASLTVTRARAGAQAEHGPKKRPLSAQRRPQLSSR
jgi:hypothetical protein